ncbi:MAG TPA: hypothetical protein VGO43_13385 [Pyrinomonadaceae bacterium]|jgi:hypothetical protein|nr:hypothetical protein [Pyrinomonadaceae bacterium]
MRRNTFIGAVFLVVAAAVPLFADPTIANIDRIRIAEAFRIGEKVQNKLWANWSDAPFAMDFITDDYEFLIRHPKPNDEFRSIGYDKLLKSEVFWRPRKFKKDFLATFPAFSATPVIVAGKAENTTDKTSTRWLFVILHEHFHQLQYSRPGYFDDVNALGLTGGDTSGMWQLNFPFPYEDKKAAADFRALTDRLLTVYEAKGRAQQRAKLSEYLASRQRFFDALGADNAKYASFQIWQEGIARYTQYRTAAIASRKVRPSMEFSRLADFTPFQAETDRLLTTTISELKQLDLTNWGRTVFYPFGATEGLVLDRVDKNWRKRYFSDKFAIEKFYPRGKTK